MNTPLTILSGNTHPELAKAIASRLLSTVGSTTVELFPDSEIGVTINQNIRGHEVYIVQPTVQTSTLSANDALMEVLLLVDAAKRASASKITAVIPYFGYARQDRKERSRSPISAKLVATMLETAGIDRIITLDLHASQIQGFFDVPMDHLYSSHLFINHILAGAWKPDVVIAPDAGGVKLADYYAKKLNIGSGSIAKRRVDSLTVEAIQVNADTKDKHVLIVDDMTQSAGTLIQAAKILKGQGALSVKAAVAHGVLHETGLARLHADTALDELIVTNSVPQKNVPKVTVIDISELFAAAINGIHTNTSIASLYTN